MKQAKTEYDGSTPLKSVMQEMFVSNLLKGMPQYKAYQKAGYKGKNEAILMSNANNLLKRNKKVAARIEYRRADIEVKTDITAVSLQHDMYNLYKKAEREGKYTAAESCLRDLMKSVGGFQADKQPEANLIGKALDTETAREVRKALEAVFKRKYLALPSDREVIDVEPS